MSHRRASGKDWLWEPTRQAIYLRDGDQCVACGEAEWGLTIDHVDPRGGNDASNLVTLCPGCNSRKRNYDLDVWADADTAARVRAAARPLTADERSAGRARAHARRPQRHVAHRARKLNQTSRARLASIPATEAPF
jgi:hypothetical protein